MAYTSRHLHRLQRQGLMVYRNGYFLNTSRDILSRNLATSSKPAPNRFNVNCYNVIDKYDKNNKTARRLLTYPLAFNSRYGVRSIQTSQRLLAQEPWMISDYEVNAMISAEESSGEIKDGIVQRFEANHLASNSPIEDRKFIAKLLHEDGGYLFGVLDGHGGDGCARSVCQRLANYIALSLMKPEVLSELNSVPKLVDFVCMSSNEYNDYSYIDDPVCQKNFEEYLEHLQRNPGYDYPQYKTRRPRKQKAGGLQARAQELLDSQLQYKVHALINAYLALDEDISQEASTFNENGEVDKHLFDAANAGACALVAHLNGTELCIANTGDCRAVLGIQNQDNSWSAIQLTSDHTAGNPEEVQRIVSQHPLEEATTCIQYERLLRRLAPFRSFGDVRFKWDTEMQKKVYPQFSVPYFTEKEHFYTPPYLTAEPEVTTYQLQRTDKFLVLATDGLWDMLSNEEVVHFVQEHLMKRDSPPVSNEPYTITYNEHELPCELNNSASCLIREALGGEDHVAVSTVLSIPHPDSRLYRDDMTVIAVFFDWDQMDSPGEFEDNII